MQASFDTSLVQNMRPLTRSTEMETDARLIEERRELVAAERDTYSPEYFPGSAAWKRNRVAQWALKAFDAEHPEVLAGIKAAQAAAKAKESAYWNSPEGLRKQAGM